MSYERFCDIQKNATPNIEYSEEELQRLWSKARYSGFHQSVKKGEESQISIAEYKRFCYIIRGYQNSITYTEADLAAMWAAHTYAEYVPSMPEVKAEQLRIRKERIAYLWAQHYKIMEELAKIDTTYTIED